MRKLRKKAHKKVVKYMRKLNSTLAADEFLGINRFRIDLYSEDCDTFDDKSGVILYLIFKLTDKVTGNTAYFSTADHCYDWEISRYVNDFLIRCSSGHAGHYPRLHYLAYDVHEIVPYPHNKMHKIVTIEDGVIDTYSWIGDLYE